MTPDVNLAAIVGSIYSSTAIGVGVILGAAGLGSALGWGLICSKYLEGIARQPEMMPTLRLWMFVTAGLMESFPFIVLAFAMYFTFANPFVGAALRAVKALAH